MDTNETIGANNTVDTRFRQTDLPIGDCLRRGWDLALQNLGPLIGYTCIVMAISVALNLIWVIGSIAHFVVQPALSAGYFIFIRRKYRNQPAQFGHFFDGFHYLGPLFVLGLVSTILIAVGLVLCIVPGLYLMLGYWFASFLVVARNLDFWQALETSRRAVTANIGSMIVLVLVLAAINLAGTLACFIGLILTVPWTFCTGVVAYHHFFEDSIPPIPPPDPGPLNIEA